MPGKYTKRKQKGDAGVTEAKAYVLQSKNKPKAKVNSPKAATPKVKNTITIEQKKRDKKRAAMIEMKKRRKAEARADISSKEARKRMSKQAPRMIGDAMDRPKRQALPKRKY